MRQPLTGVVQVALAPTDGAFLACVGELVLTSLDIENSKGIGARQRIEFAPLTLLFGANSAGKSSIL